MTKTLSYHDVVAIVVEEDGTEREIRIADRYGIELTCNRVGGWCLWDTEASKLIAGEYDFPKLRIKVKDTFIL